MKKLKSNFLLVIFPLVILFSCQESPNDDMTDPGPGYPDITNMDSLSASDGFNWQLTENVSFAIRALDNTDQAIRGVRFDVFKVTGEGEDLLFSGMTGSDGYFRSEHPFAADVDQIVVRTKYIGLANEIVLPVESGRVNYVFGGKQQNLKSLEGAETVSNVNTEFAYLGSYNSFGVPNYLEPQNDPISEEFLENVNAALPENQPVPQFHPEYLAESNETNLVLLEDAEVWVTFLHEGAGYKNTLGFYTYTIGNPPVTPTDIDTITVLFPNASFHNSGGGLFSGNKVRVRIGYFTANTVIGWVLLANGWQGNQVSRNVTHYYSDYAFNPETNPAKKQHNVLLYDAEFDVAIIGWEDLNRSSGSDDDFNDAIFYVTSNPISAIDVSNLPPVDPNLTDTDGDGVADQADDYPYDPDKAFNHYYPSFSSEGTLSFEDKWPSKGDYDFNDLVVDYNFNQITNATNEIVQIDAVLQVKAVGAGYRNGFGFVLPLSPADVLSVTGMNLQHDIINLSANQTEAGQEYATIIAFDNAFNLFENNQVRYINTETSTTYETPAEINISTVLANPANMVGFDQPPYNPFLIVNLDRGKEVHLPDHEPSSLADASHFGTENDDSNPNSGKFYKTSANLPWVMHIPAPFDYPREKKPVILGHLVFKDWVFSSGTVYSDWYKNKPGYRNPNNIYYRQP